MSGEIFKGFFRSGVFILLFFLIQVRVQATHLRAGEITVTRQDCSSGYTFKITITVYTNTGSSVQFSDHEDGELDFGDGTPINNPPQTAGIPVPGFPGFGYVVYSIEHTYGGPGRYVINYMEPNRNAGILNMSNSVNTPFDIYTVINIDPFLGCDNSPQLLVPPIDKACTGTAWFHNAGAYDPDGDSLSYQLVVPKQDPIDNVYGYTNPNNQGFYSGLAYPYGLDNENHTGPPTFSINDTTGTVTWDAPGLAGQYNIAFHIIEWRKIAGVWVQLGYVTRDMQIIVEDCSNHRPQLIGPADICVVAGTTIHQDIYGTDQDFNPVEIQAFSQVFSINPSPATVTPVDTYQSTGPPATQAVLSFTWNTVCTDVKEQPYEVVFKITDQPPQNTGGVPLVSFATWNIRVVGPAPIWTSVAPLSERRVQLKWQSYQCSNAQTMEIWRRIESYPYTPPPCVTGIPGFLGYTMIAQVPIGTTQYIDTNGGKGLSPGAQYCYRLVAEFPLPQGGESYVSAESCLTVLGDAPIITNVSIDKTGTTDGEDTVKWVSPLASDINTTLFPPPYTYALWRAEGFSGNALTRVFPGTTPATSFIDNGLNTSSTVYNYRVVAYDSNKTLIDTSALASTVRLELKPHLNSVELNWSANVPWNNQTLTYPLHTIYRGPAGSTQVSQLTLIDNVDVTQKQFHYIDSGQYNNTPLDKNQTYCYCVKTVGSYGNPKIIDPLINFSEILCAQPNDTIRPCKVVLKVKGTGCDYYLAHSNCASNTFSDTLAWNHPPVTCPAEVFSYNIYIASQVGGAFTLYAQNVKDTIFIDTNLPSFARCYKVSAINRGGTESPLSDPFCFDNCPHYELPNVFTPGNADGCNDFFSAYSARDSSTVEGGVNTKCPPANVQGHCARFVNAVNFTVYNRWGKEVFTFQSGGEDSIYIDWNGTDDQGAELPAGVYYYLAQVNFNVVDPSKQNKTIKGWVQLIR